MMKRYIWVLILTVAICLISPNAYADNMFKKLGRGLLNIVSSPIELFLQPCRASIVEHAGPAGGFSSVFRGFGFMFGRIVAGIYDISTFPLPIPFGYKPIFQPETVFDGISWVMQKDWPFPRYGFGRQVDPTR